MSSHFVHRVEDFPTNRTRSGVGAMFVLNVIGNILNVLRAVGTVSWSIREVTWKQKIDIQLNVVKVQL